MIAISPGHFGIGTGAVGLVDEVKEARRVVDEVCKLLEQQNVKVYKIVDNTSKNARENLRYLNRQHENINRKLDVFVHFNATAKVEKRGIGVEVLYKNAQVKPLAQALSMAISNVSGLKNRGAKLRTDLFMLNNSSVDAVLIEVCFVNSEQDVATYQQHFHAICLAITQQLLQHVGDVPFLMTSIKGEHFSSKTLQKKVQSLFYDKYLIEQIVQSAIRQNIIQKDWLKRLHANQLTYLDVCGISLLLYKKQIK